MAPEVAAKAAKRGMHDALDEWKREAVDIAPIAEELGGTLRQSIHTSKITGKGLNLTGEITASAIEKSNGRRFDYAYYIHEKDAGGKKLRLPSAEKKFLDVPLERNDEKWAHEIEAEIKDEMRKLGW